MVAFPKQAEDVIDRLIRLENQISDKEWSRGYRTRRATTSLEVYNKLDKILNPIINERHAVVALRYAAALTDWIHHHMDLDARQLIGITRIRRLIDQITERTVPYLENRAVLETGLTALSYFDAKESAHAIQTLVTLGLFEHRRNPEPTKFLCEVAEKSTRVCVSNDERIIRFLPDMLVQVMLAHVSKQQVVQPAAKALKNVVKSLLPEHFRRPELHERIPFCLNMTALCAHTRGDVETTEACLAIKTIAARFMPIDGWAVYNFAGISTMTTPRETRIAKRARLGSETK